MLEQNVLVFHHTSRSSRNNHSLDDIRLVEYSTRDPIRKVRGITEQSVEKMNGWS